MHTIYFWRHTYPLTGRRTTTRFRLSEEDARCTLVDPERVEYDALVIGPLAPHSTWAGPTDPPAYIRQMGAETDHEG